MKYIDADKLVAEIERWRDKAKERYNENTYSMGRCDALAEFRNYMVSLLKEQPEVDLEEEIDAVWNPRFNLGWDEHSALSMNHAGFARFARHFYELGLNAKKEK